MPLSNYSFDNMNKYLNNTYYIPNYQREYSWEKEELEDFWQDLQDTITINDDHEHFFGQIVIHNSSEDNKLYIIDGQQRTITSVIFLSALRKHFVDIYTTDPSIKKADYNKDDITSIHIGRQDTLHLFLGDLDKDYFRDNIQLGTPTGAKEKKKSHERIRKAYTFFYDELTKIADTYSSYQEKFDALDEIYTTFINGFRVFYMEATKLEEAFVIFETLNARGKELETADLLKNFIFGRSPDHIDESQRKWETMISNLGSTDPTKYIRHFWNSQFEMAREKSLYRTISKTIKTPRQSRELLNDLESCSQLYHDLSNPSASVTIDDPQFLSSLKALELFKASSFYPIFLAMSLSETHFTKSDFAVVSSTVEKYVFRNATICKRTSNRTETFFSQIARKIYGEELITAQQICDAISDGMVTNDEFESAFSLWSAPKTNKEIVRYIFRKIHNHLDPDSELNTDNMVVHIEHIMPETIGEWEIDEETHDEYLWRLGNLALLKGTLNTAISNKLFDEKKDRYEESQIKPNDELLEYSVWTPKEIEDRQNRLAKYALEIWSR